MKKHSTNFPPDNKTSKKRTPSNIFQTSEDNQFACMNNQSTTSPKSKSSTTIKRETVTWGINSQQEVFQTTHTTHFLTHDKLKSKPKMREPCIYSDNLSGSLIPVNASQSKKGKQLGHYHHVHTRRVPSEGDTFFDKIGERKQPSPDRGRFHITEPRVQDPALRHVHRFYKPVDPLHGKSHQNLSPSRLIKQVLDYCPPDSIVAGGASATKNIESLSFTATMDHSNTKLADTFGGGHSHVDKKLKDHKPKGIRVYNLPENEVKSLLSHSYVFTQESSFAEPNKEVITKVESLSSRTADKANPTLHLKRLNLDRSMREQQMPDQGQENEEVLKRRQSLAPKIGHLSERDFSQYYGRRRSSIKENSQKKSLTKNSSVNSFRMDARGVNTSASRERSRSNSVGAQRDFSLRNSIRKVETDESQDKNSFTLVSHEKKKPTTGGTFTNPMLSKGFVQKKMKAAAMGTLNSFQKKTIK